MSEHPFPGPPTSRPVGSYRELAVWRLALKLAVDCNRLADGFPVVQRFGLGSQIRRAAGSVPANIAEGYGRLHRSDYVHHLSIARGSLKELETHLLVARQLHHLAEHDAANLDRRCTLVGRMLSRLIVSLYKRDGRPDGRSRPMPGPKEHSAVPDTPTR